VNAQEISRFIRAACEKDPDPQTSATFLALRVVRVCEAAAEYAARNRWDMLVAPGESPDDLAHRVAQLCAEAAISEWPVRGEAAVYAALLGAVDIARDAEAAARARKNRSRS